MVRFLKVKLKPEEFPAYQPTGLIDTYHPHLDYHRDRCVLCGRCTHSCPDRSGRPLFTFTGRGSGTVVAPLFPPAGQPVDKDARQSCVDLCPPAP